MTTLKSEKGVALMIVLVVSIVATIYVSSYALWTIWDQRTLARQQIVDLAHELAVSGLNRAMVNLQVDSNWLDGNINGKNVTLPNTGTPNAFYNLYNATVAGGNATLASGNYTVDIRYLFNNATSTFYSNRMWVRSTGITPTASRTLQQIVNANAVRNQNTTSLYFLVQPGMTDTTTLTNHYLAMGDFKLNENVTFSGNKNLTVAGCFDQGFSYRSCMDYYSAINGTFTVSGNANVTLSGITIE